MTKVKICGITNYDDAEWSVRHGADALGFNFYRKSPRYIDPASARTIIDRLPPNILNVGVFVNEPLESITETARVSGIGAVQLHGEESPDFVRSVKSATGLAVIKAFRIKPGFRIEDVLEFDVDAILLDAYSPKEHGGTGEAFDWKIAKEIAEIVPGLYLAGGLSGDNIADAIESVAPHAVDACSLLESVPGRKDPERVRDFLMNSKQSV